MKKSNPSLVGLLQALGVIIYAALISGFFQFMARITVQPSIFITSAVMLAILVFSVAVCGLIVFGYPAYLALHGKIKEGLAILGFTLLYCLGMIAIMLILITALA